MLRTFLRQVMARHQSSQLKSDMQAFKAANPGCVLEDFVRWRSPADWLPLVAGLSLSPELAALSTEEDNG